MPVEGEVTRCLAVFTDIGAVEKLGSIRSARIYTASLVQALDAILVRAGGSAEADEALTNMGWSQIDGIKGYAANTFYRDQERKKAGYALEHTLFTSGAALIENAESRKLPLVREQGIDYGLIFKEDATPAGEDAGSITIHFASYKNAKTSTFRYDSESGKYLASQFGENWIDRNTDETLAFENVLVMKADTWVQKDGEHKSIQLVGSGKGYFACGGKIVPILWSRSAENKPFVYTLEDGTPLELGIGKTYIGITPILAPTEWNN
jgi:hypothetical protein